MVLLNRSLLLFGLLFIYNSGHASSQTKRSSRLTGSRTFSLNTKSASVHQTDFECPEEFGYYPHPSDCTQYYVCVFGGALLESCTGGLMYSHELQTCDWPRNVGCEIAEVSSLPSPLSSSTPHSRTLNVRVPKIQQQTQYQIQTPQRFRYSTQSDIISQQQNKDISNQHHYSQQQQHRQQQQQQEHQQQQQYIQLSTSSIPPPPELRIAPNPVITSRGQPKILLDSQEDIAKLYAEAHDSLPPAEEEENDRQQRVYRGQPSTVGQVQRDRDGIIHQPNINSLPHHGKVGSYAFGSQVNQYSSHIENFKHERNDNHLKRRKRNIDIDNDENKTTKFQYEFNDDETKNTTANKIDENNKNIMTINNTKTNTQRSVRAVKQIATSYQNGDFYFHNTYLPESMNPFISLNPYYSLPSEQNTNFQRGRNIFGVKNLKTNLRSYEQLLTNHNKNNLTPDIKIIEHYSINPTEQIFGDYIKSTTSTPISLRSSSSSYLNPFKDFRNYPEQFYDYSNNGRHDRNYRNYYSGKYLNPQSNGHYEQYLRPSEIRNQNIFYSTISNLMNNNHKQSMYDHHTRQPFINIFTTTESPIDSTYFTHNFQHKINHNNLIQTTPKSYEKHAPDFSNINYYPKTIVSITPKIYKYSITNNQNLNNTITQNYENLYIKNNQTPSQIQNLFNLNQISSTTEKSIDIDFKNFLIGIRQSHIVQADPKIIDMLKFYKENQNYKIINETSSSTKQLTKINNSFFNITKPLNLFNSIIKNISKQNNTIINNKNNYEINDDNKNEEENFDYEIEPPAIKSPFMPETETMAPKLSKSITTIHSLLLTNNNSYTSSLLKPNISTSKLLFSSHYRDHNNNKNNNNNNNNSIPSIITFPTDIFHSISFISSNNHKISNSQTNEQLANIKSNGNDILTVRTTTTSPITIQRTTKKFYTIRPHNRGNFKWKTTNKMITKTNKDPRQFQQHNIELDEKLPNRVETSPPSSTNVYLPQRPKISNDQNTRNYYNTTNNYQSPSYDSFYSVYDDDVELYRNIDYNNHQQQYNTNNQRIKQKPTIQSTYRPENIVAPSSVPARETYISKTQSRQPINTQQQQEQQNYNQPSLVYDTDYEDALIAQIEDDNNYNNPTRNPIRGDRIEINSINERPIIISSTPRTINQPKYTPVTYEITKTIPIQQQQQQQLNPPKPSPTQQPPPLLQSSIPTQPSRNNPTRPVEHYTQTLSTTQTTTKPTQSFRSTPTNGDNNNMTTISNTGSPSDNGYNNHQSTLLPISKYRQSFPISQNIYNINQQSSPSLLSLNHHLFDNEQSNTDIKENIKNITNIKNENNTKILNQNLNIVETTTLRNIDTIINKNLINPSKVNINNNDDDIKKLSSFIFKKIEPKQFQIISSTPENLEINRNLKKIQINDINFEQFESDETLKYSSPSSIEEITLINDNIKNDGKTPIYIRPTMEPASSISQYSFRLTKTRPAPFASKDIKFIGDNQEYNYEKEQFLDTNSKNIIKNNNKKILTDKLYNDKIPAITTRALIFKDNLNKNFDTTSSPKFVSPYKSLENILQEKDKSKNFYKFNLTTTTTTSNPNTSNKSPYRSYFIITSPTKIVPSNNISLASTFYYNPITNPTTTTTTTTSTTRKTTTIPLTSTTSPNIIESQINTNNFSLYQNLNKTDINKNNSLTTEKLIEYDDNPLYNIKQRGRLKFTTSYKDEQSEYIIKPTTYTPKQRYINTQNDRSTETIIKPNKRIVIRTRPLFTSIGDIKGQRIQTNNNQNYEYAALKAENLSEIFYYNNNNNFNNLKGIKSYNIINENDTIDKNQQYIYLKNNYTKSPISTITTTKSFDKDNIIKISDSISENISEIPLIVNEKNSSINLKTTIGDNYTIQKTIPLIWPDIKHSSTNLPNLLTSSSSTTTTTTINSPRSSSTTITTMKYTSTTPTKSPIITNTFLTINNSTTDLIFNDNILTNNTSTYKPTTTTTTTTTIFPKMLLLPRVSRVNNAIKSSIAATSRFKSPTSTNVKCIDNSPNTKCNEIPSRTNTRNRGNTNYNIGNNERDQQSTVAANRGTHPPRTRPTLKPSGAIVSKAVEFIDIYRNLPSRPEALYPQPNPDKTAAKCRKDVCLLPDCYCGGKDIPGDLPVENVPQIVLLTFDDSVNDLNKQLYSDLFEKGRTNPNGCPITATFYVSHEWTDYSQVQNLYSDGHEMASHTISHSFGEQFSQKKWTREVSGQREILSAYGGVKLSDIRGMRAPFLSVGGNKMFKMLYDSNFTYDSSMPVYENRPPSWPYTLDYKIFHDCMIPPCPTKSYPGVWEVPMVMWQDLNGGRCSMGDACSNPADADGVYKMLMKNFERHYTSSRAPFGLFYHAAWFTQPHHKDGFIKFLDAINAMNDVWIVTNWQALQWIRDPTPLSRINQFQPFQCDYSDRPKRCSNAKVCNLWHKSGVRYMRTCQPCPDIYPWTGKTGIRSSRVDNEIED